MNIQEALNIFGLSGDLTEKDIKTAYKKAALKYHPDRNPLGAELMKAVNAAFDFLMANIDKINQFQSADENARYDYSEELEKVLNVLSGLSGVVYEVIGNWIWISGDTKEHKDTLKEMGCKWAAKKNSGSIVLKNTKAAVIVKNTALMKSVRCMAQPDNTKRKAGGR